MTGLGSSISKRGSASSSDSALHGLSLSRKIGLVPPGWDRLDQAATVEEFSGLMAMAMDLAGRNWGNTEGEEFAGLMTSEMSRHSAILCALEVYRQQPFRLVEATLTEIQAALESGKVSSRELVRVYLDRIKTFDVQGPQIKAMLFINPGALSQAEELDQERRMRGSRGVLHGIPIVVKDNYGTSDMPTTCGTCVLKSFFPSSDADVVKKLRQAGAIILGKSNLHELALFGTTYSSLGGQTRNPYDLTKTPGGSSGGTGAAVSANFAAAGTGTDAVNSVRSPASANNLVGIRPTKGLVCLEGIMPVSRTQDNAGPIARTVLDAAVLLEIMIGNGWRCTDDLIDDLRGIRIGVLRSFWGTDTIHAEVNGVSESALRVMRDLGAVVVDVATPELDADQLLGDLDVQRFEIKHELERYFALHQAPVKSFAQLLGAGPHDSLTASFLQTVQAIEDPLQQPEYRSRLQRIELLKVRVLEVMDVSRVDVLFYPHQKRVVVDVGENLQSDRNGILSALTGFPSITFPGGFSKPTASAPIGVPIGVEFLSRPHEEAKLIAIAYRFEQATHYRRLPPTTPEYGYSQSSVAATV